MVMVASKSKRNILEQCVEACDSMRDKDCNVTSLKIRCGRSTYY